MIECQKCKMCKCLGVKRLYKFVPNAYYCFVYCVCMAINIESVVIFKGSNFFPGVSQFFLGENDCGVTFS